MKPIDVQNPAKSLPIGDARAELDELGWPGLGQRVRELGGSDDRSHHCGGAQVRHREAFAYQVAARPDLGFEPIEVGTDPLPGTLDPSGVDSPMLRRNDGRRSGNTARQQHRVHVPKPSVAMRALRGRPE